MLPVIIGFGALLLVLLVVVLALYNTLVSARAHVRESWSNVDTELQRRHDLIPNLVNTVKGYMKHERELLENIVSLREQAERLRPGEATQDQARVETALQSALGQLRVRIENYPELKAGTNVESLQAELANTEDRVQSAIRFYNGNVKNLELKVESVPTNFIASMFGFKKAQYFELQDEAARRAPKVEF